MARAAVRKVKRMQSNRRARPRQAPGPCRRQEAQKFTQRIQRRAGNGRAPGSGM